METQKEGAGMQAAASDPRQQQRDNSEKQRQHCQKPLADGLRLVDLQLGTDVAHAELGPRPRYFLTQSLGERERVGAVGAYNERASAPWRHGRPCPCPALVNRLKREIDCRQDGLAHAAIPGVANQAHDPETTVPFVEGFSYGILTVEVSLRECLIDDGNAQRRVAREKISPVNEGNFHGVDPAGRDTEKVGEDSVLRYPADRNIATKAVPDEQRPTRHRNLLHTRHRSQMVGDLVPVQRWLGTLRDSIQSEKTFR